MLSVSIFVITPDGKNNILLLTENDGSLPNFGLDGIALLKEQLLSKVNEFFQITDSWADFHALGYIEPPTVLYFGLLVPEAVQINKGSWQPLEMYMPNMKSEVFARLSRFVLESL